jgi:TolB-like protein
MWRKLRLVVTVTNSAPDIEWVDTDTVTTVSEADVRAELERILASKGFAAAGRLSRLLRYVVEKTIADAGDELKEYSVGVEVFDRDANYDTRLDSIVRVEAGRLRSRLDEYYNGEGARSPIRISLPRGGYVAKFELMPPANAMPRGDGPSGPSSTKRTSWAAWPLTAGLICAVAAMVVWLGGWNRTPAQGDNADVAVLPFSSNAEDAAIANRLTETMTTELARLGTVSVASYTSSTRLGETRRPLREIASALNVNFAVEASVEPDGDGLLVMVRLVDAETDRKIWVSDYRGPRDNSRAIAQRIAFDVSAELVKRHSP